ncbi:accessory gene regulator ArgB-like protein [Paenibacillus wynnii]|uniref:accessory gene regulator ArgB-like protein n=1 Tax=Paenibacillus wynnii TaxID=268407 RepID=UPI0027900A57|nr:accessory gene regulator B family protein [Paenibacillus wynnii]MDQ0193509.1 accessory gene regulator B [Paenibacillus wynnii]
MIEIMATKLAVRIKLIVPEHPASESVLKFALSLLINAISIIFFSLVISLLTAKTQETVTVLIAFAILRQLTGGFHLKSGFWCVVGTTSIISVMSLLQTSALWIQILNITGILLVLFYAPSGIQKQSRIPSKYYPYLKIAAALIVASNLLIQSPMLALSFFFQSATLIKLRR